MSGEQAGKTVSVVRCEDYSRDNVFRAVKEAVEKIGGIGKFASPGQKVFLKFNLLQGAAAEKCVTTNPEVVYAVARLLKEHGCMVLMGDSPGSGQTYSEKVLRKNYAAAGYDRIADELKIPLNFDTGYREIPAPDGKMVKRFTVISPVLDADVLVVVSKAKCHTFTFLSAATKNLFGVIPGFDKPLYHGRMPDREDFSRMLVDLNEAVRPDLQIMDAIIAMEGDGPHTGSPRKIGAILASANPAAIDVVTARMMAFDPLRIGTIKAAVERGLLKEDFSDITIVGEDPANLVVPDFLHPSTYAEFGKEGGKPGLVKRMVYGIWVSLARAYPPWPRIEEEKCVSCMKCVRSCPKKTIHVRGKTPEIDHTNCIRCYCCHEMCDSHAIALERSLAGKILAAIVRYG